MKMMSKWTLGAAVVLSSTAQAASYVAEAPVVDVVPIVSERYVPHRVERCEVVRKARYRYDDHHGVSPVGSIVGGVLGGLVGNQFGGGNGKTALTAVGAVVGATIGNRAAHRRAHGPAYYEPVERCRTVTEHEVVQEVTGYDVTYVYNGQEFVKRSRVRPGDTIPVKVEVTPVVRI